MKAKDSILAFNSAPIPICPPKGIPKRKCNRRSNGQICRASSEDNYKCIEGEWKLVEEDRKKVKKYKNSLKCKRFS